MIALGKPLDGIRVVDLTTSIAGPYCTLLLGALGAEILKIERPGAGDDTRAWGPPFWNGESATFLSMNAGKRSLAIDIRSTEGKEIVLRLVERADVFVQNLRPGTAGRLGFDADALSKRNAALIYCSIGAFGKTGPLAEQPGYDPLMQAFGGIMSVTGELGRPPVRSGASIVDQGTGMWATIGVLGALRERDRDGRRRVVDTALFETALAWLPFQIAGYLASGSIPGPHGSGLSILAPYELFEAEDAPVMIAAGNDNLFARLCIALEISDLAEDPRFVTNADRIQNRGALALLIGERTRTLRAAELRERLEQAGVPSAPIQNVEEVVGHPQTEASGLIEPVAHPGIPDLKLVGMPISIDDERVSLPGPPPRLGEHTGAVLREIGFEPDAIADLAARGLVGLPD